MNKFLLHSLLKPLGQSSYGSYFKRDAAVLAAGITATAATANAGMSAAAANANSHHGRVFSRWAVKQSQEEAARAREWQSGESRLAREWEEYMYNMYNSPSAMMQQYRAAGINPFLAGKAEIGSPMSSSAPMSGAGPSGSVVPAPTQYMPDFSGIERAGSAFMQALGVKANIANQEAEAKQKLWDTADKVYYHFGADAFKDFAKQNNLFAPDNVSGSSLYGQYLVGQIMKENQESYLLQVEAGFKENYSKPQAEAYTNVLMKQLAYMDQQIATLKSQEDLNYATGKRVGSEIARNMAEAMRAAAETGTINMLRQYLVSTACFQTGISAMQYMQYFSEYTGDELWRDWQQSEAGKKTRFIMRQEDPRNNPVFGFVKGLSESLGVMPGQLSPYIKRPNAPAVNNFWIP